MPCYDYECPVCGNRLTLTVAHAVADEQMCCSLPPADATYWAICRGQLRRQPSAPNFSVKGFNARNGYSK